jgi:hypothetical protein
MKAERDGIMLGLQTIGKNVLLAGSKFHELLPA